MYEIYVCQCIILGGPPSATSCLPGAAVPQFPGGQPLPSLLTVAQSSGPLARLLHSLPQQIPHTHLIITPISTKIRE